MLYKNWKRNFTCSCVALSTSNSVTNCKSFKVIADVVSSFKRIFYGSIYLKPAKN